MKVTIVMCEGPHDVAFLSRIMHAVGFHTYNEVLNDYPAFVARFITEHIVNGSLDDLNLKEARGGLFLPSFALVKNDRLLLLYQLKGDSKKEGRKKIISSFDTAFKNAGFGTPGLPQAGDSLSIVYVFDADDKGVVKRVEEINAELSLFLNLGRDASVKQAGFDMLNGIKYGAYIFHIADDNDGHGRLEDMILPLMRIENEDILSDADVLIQKRERREYKLFVEKSKEKDRDFDKQKATIGIMGQLQKSGTPNSTIIEQSAYLTDEVILADNLCRQLIDFVNASFE